jgi:hypothetical protein
MNLLFVIISISFRFDLAGYDFTVATKPQTYVFEHRKNFQYFTPLEISSINVGRFVAFKPLSENSAIGLGVIGFKSNSLWVADSENYYDHLKSFFPVQASYIYTIKHRNNLFVLGNYGEISLWSIRDHDNPWMYLEYGLSFGWQPVNKISKRLGIILEMKLGQITMFYDYKPPVDLTSWYITFGLASGGYFGKFF